MMGTTPDLDGFKEHNPCSNGDVERVLSSVHGDLQRRIAESQYLRLYTHELVAEDERCRELLGLEAVIGTALGGKLYGEDSNTASTKLFDSFGGRTDIPPGDGLRCSERGLGNLLPWWGRREATQDELLRPNGIGGAEDGAYVVEAAYVVQNDNERMARSMAKLLRGEPLLAKLLVAPLAHGERGQRCNFS